MKTSNQNWAHKYPLTRRFKPNHFGSNNSEELFISKKNGKSKLLDSNVTFQVPNIIDKQVEVFEQKEKDTLTKHESKLKVPIDELKSPLKEMNQLETQFDMFKDEYNLKELLELNITEIPFLVEKLIPKETLVVLAGQSEIGKSTLYTQLAMAIVRGDNEFLGCKLNATHKRVLVISTEDGPIPLSFRANRQVIQSTVEVEKSRNLDFIFNYDKLEDRIHRYLDKTKVDLVVMDAFGDVFWGDINASNSVRQFLNKYVNLIQKFRCTVLFVHHVCKGNNRHKTEKDQLLGSTGIEGKMRNVLMLSIVNDQHQLSIAKGNYVNRDDKKIPIYLNFDSNTLTFSRVDGPAKPMESDQSDIATSCGCESKRKPGRQRNISLYNQAIKLYEEGKSQVEIAKIIGKHKSTICKLIKDHKSKQKPS